MTLTSFLIQVGTLLVIGILAVFALQWMKRRSSGVGRSSTRSSVRLATPRPVTRLVVNQDWTPGQCADVFETLTNGQKLHFFAADVPSPSDPGGHVTAMRKSEGNITRWVGNHGWSSALKVVSLTELQDELYRNRTAQPQAYRVEKEETR